MLVKLSILAVLLGCVSESTPAMTASVDRNKYVLVDPKTGKPLPTDGYAINAVESSSTYFKAPDCQCANYFCNCCVGMEIMGRKEIVCGNVNFNVKTLAASAKLKVNDNVLWSENLSPKNPLEACIKIHNPAYGCIRLYDLSIYGKNLHGCMELSLKAIHINVLKANVGCMDLGINGVHYSKSSKNTVRMRSVSHYSDSDYDHVDFEEIQNANNHNEHTNDSDDYDKIGQLKSH